MYLRDQKAFKGLIEEREPSMMYTVARTLITDSLNVFPLMSKDHIQKQESISLYANPIVDIVLTTLMKNDKCVISIKADTWRVWYPLTDKLDIEPVNSFLTRFNDTQIHQLRLE
jgi:hypothetical protein